MSDWYCDEVLSGQCRIGVVAETPRVLAFHHTRPSYADAHVVVIPKEHVPSLVGDEADGVLPELLLVVRSIANDVVLEHGSCRVVTNLGGYQESKHLHWHVVSGDRIADPIEVTADEWRPYGSAAPVPGTAFYAALPKRYAGAGAYITDDNGQILLVKPGYKPGWELPGGVVENGETPNDTCTRECREELGIDIKIGRLLAIEHQTLDGRGDSTMYIYDGGVIDSNASIVLAPNELNDYQFVSSASIGDFLPARLVPRVLAARDARADGAVRELCSGAPR